MDGVPSVPVSWGELLDKITILELKTARIGEPAGRANAARELAVLRVAQEDAAATLPEAVRHLMRELAAVNAALWEIEDEIRLLDRAGEFGARFVAAAQTVYRTNDRRAALKREMNRVMGSGLVEEKWYAADRTTPVAA